MRRTQKTLAELTADLHMLPQPLVNKRIHKGYDWLGDERLAAAVKEARAAVEGRGRVLVRPSGTEPLLRIMVEADDPAFAETLATGMAASLSVG